VVDNEGLLAGILSEHDLTKIMAVNLIENKQLLEKQRIADELARSREQLQIRENAFRTLVENTPDTIARYDLQGRRIYANPALIKMLGKPTSEVIGKTPLEYPVKSTANLEYQQKIQSVIETGLKTHFLYEWLNEQGQIFYLNIRLIPEYDASQQIISVLGIGQDVTERKNAEDILKKSISLLHATLESSNEGLLVVDLQHNWQLYNSKFIELWELPEDIVAAKNDEQALAFVLQKLDDPTGFLKQVHNLYANPETRVFDKINFKNGKIIERYSIPQYIDEQVVGRVWSFRDITSRERAEIALKQEAEKSLALLHNASDGIHIVNRSGHIIEVSDRFCRMLGYSRTELLGMHVSGWDANCSAQEIDALLAEQFNNPHRSQFQTVHRCKDGKLLEVEVSGYALELNGEAVLFNSSRDITLRKLRERQLLASEHKYRMLIELAKDAIFLADVATATIIDCNLSATELLGKPKHAIIGLHQSQLHPADKELYYQHMFKRHIESGADMAEDVLVLHHDGHTIPVDIHASVIELNGKKVLLGIFRNITERKLADAELRIAATAFESQEGMLVTDADVRILRVNRAFSQITGYDEQEIIGLNPRILASGQHPPEFFQDMWHSINTSGAWNGEIWNRRKNGEIFPEHLSIAAVKNKSGVVTHYVATLMDITLTKAAAEEIRTLAFYDPLTGLPNRRLLLDRLNQALASSARHGRIGAILFLDLDHFKILNDTLGHDIGDLLLKQVAERLTSCIREGDTVARLGGDEFIILLEELSGDVLSAATQVEAISYKILTLLNQPYYFQHNEYRNGSSIGIVLFSDHQQSPEELLKQADIAMYQAKKSGRNTLRFFDPQMQDTINARVALEHELRKALRNKEFDLHYQIQVDENNKPIGAEVLIRWLHPELGYISPVKFIPLAEETGLILSIGHWVLETACAQLHNWQQTPLLKELTLSVNVSVKQFHQAEFAAEVQEIINRYNFNPAKLKLELTESILLDGIEAIIETMQILREMGIQFSLDDFGTGYSSLQYLKKLPLDQLKIDQSFVRDIVDDLHDRSIVRTIIAMAQNLDLNVIAEGVESEAQRLLLLNKGCKSFQGYLFGRPVAIQEFERSLKLM
jgi:diguanylate cyclase (GGDEF)-like protein/PAS domain S-box-containing protein